MSRSNIPAEPQVKIKATVHACASFQGSYCKRLARGSGEDARSRGSRIAGQLPAAIEGLAARCGFQKRNKTEKCPAGLAGARSRKAPRPGGDRLAQPIRRMNVAGVSQGTPARWRPFGPAYPQDERGRGTRDGGIVPEQILSAARNLNSGWNTDQNVPHLEMQHPFWVGRCVMANSVWRGHILARRL